MLSGVVGGGKVANSDISDKRKFRPDLRNEMYTKGRNLFHTICSRGNDGRRTTIDWWISDDRADCRRVASGLRSSIILIGVYSVYSRESLIAPKTIQKMPKTLSVRDRCICSFSSIIQLSRTGQLQSHREQHGRSEQKPIRKKTWADLAYSAAAEHV